MNPLEDLVAYRNKQAQYADLFQKLKLKQQEEQAARSTFSQMTQPLIGSLANTFGGALGGAAQLFGTGVEALTPWNGAGRNIRDTGTDFRDMIARNVESSPFATVSRPGENSFITNISSGLGSLAASMGTYGLGKAAGLSRGVSSAVPAGLFGASAGGEQAQGAIDAGKSPQFAALMGLLGGGAEAGLEKFGIEKYAGAGGGALRKLGTRMATEGTQEGLQSLAQSAVRSSYDNVNPGEAIKQAGTEAFYGGLVGGIGDVSTRTSMATKKALAEMGEGGFASAQPLDVRQWLANDKVLKNNEFDVGITNVAGKNMTQSDLDWQSALAKGVDLNKPSVVATDYGRKQIQSKFYGSGIKVKSEPGFGVFEANPEPSIDMKARVNDKQLPQFLSNLADLGENDFAQSSVITYRGTDNTDFGWVDKNNGISAEPMVRIRLNQAQEASNASELNELLSKYDLAGASVKDRGTTLDITNLTYYNDNYEQFQDNAISLIEELENRGLLESFDTTIAEVRHFGQEGEAPTTYGRIRSQFATPSDWKTDETIRTRLLDHLPKKEMVSQPELEQLLNKPDITQAEKDTAKKVISEIDFNQTSLLPGGARGGRIPTGMFIAKLQAKTTPMTTEDTTKWSDYGLDNLDLGATSEPVTTKVKVPVDLAGRTDHFGEKDNFGHFRWFELENPIPNKIQRLKDRRAYLGGEELKGGNFKQEMATIDKEIKAADKEVWDYKDTAFILEEQADAFQHGLGVTGDTQTIETTAEIARRENRIKELAKEIGDLRLRRLDVLVAENNGKARTPSGMKQSDYNYNTGVTNDIDGEIRQSLASMKAHQDWIESAKRKPQKGSVEQQITNFAKDNKYRRRLLEESLIYLKNKGFKYAMLPTPSTAVTVQGYVSSDIDGAAPYQNVDGDIVTPDTPDLEIGDSIEYGGEEMTVVQASDYEITVAPADKVSSWRMSDDIDEQVAEHWNEAIYEINNDLEKGITPEYAEELKKEVSWLTELLLEEIIYSKDTVNLKNVEELEEKVKENMRNQIEETYYDNLQDIWGNDKVFSDESSNQYDPMIYVISEDSYTESFNQPDQYEPAMDREELINIDFDKRAIDQIGLDDTQKSVLTNYYDMQDTLKKMQKDDDIAIEYHVQENQNAEPVTWFKVDLSKMIKRTAF